MEMLSRERFILINAEAIDIGGHCLFFLLNAAALNAYKLYLIDDFRTEGKKLTRTDFTHHFALSLMKNPAGQTRRHESKIRIQTNSEPFVSTPEQHYIYSSGEEAEMRALQCQ